MELIDQPLPPEFSTIQKSTHTYKKKPKPNVYNHTQQQPKNLHRSNLFSFFGINTAIIMLVLYLHIESYNLAQRFKIEEKTKIKPSW